MHVVGGTLVNATDIAGRRRLIFKYKVLALTPTEMLPLICEHYPTSIDTVRRDLREMSRWLPSMLSLQEDEADTSLYRLMGLIRISQDQLAKLSVSADNDSARVGASKSLAAIACKEIELRQDLGRIPRMPISIQHLESIDLEGLDEKAVLAMMANFEQSEADRHRRIENEYHHPGEDAGQESPLNRIGPCEGVKGENESRTRPSSFGSPVSSNPTVQARTVQDATMENTRQIGPEKTFFDSETVSEGVLVESSRLVDTSRNGSMAGGYVVRRS